MRTFWIPMVAIAALAPLCAPAADAYQSGTNLYRSVWSHLDRAQKRAAPYPGDWYRFDVARGQIDLLQRTWKAGSCERSQMDAAMLDVQRVLDNSNVSPLDRKILSGDLEKLRDNQLRYCPGN